MKLSFVLPTIFPTLAGGAIAAVHEAAADIEHEIVVVSPFEISGPGVRWVRERDPRGSIAECNFGFKHATGDILVLIAAGRGRRLTRPRVRPLQILRALRAFGGRLFPNGAPRKTRSISILPSIFCR
jgi:hypothetical protein